jgi:hypothetical protein
MERKSSLGYMIDGAKPIVKDYSAREVIMTKVSEILLAPNSKQARKMIANLRHLDGTIPTANGPLDTSFFADSYFNRNQLKVFSGTPEEFEHLVNSYEVPPRNEGITEKHPCRNEAMAYLHNTIRAG